MCKYTNGIYRILCIWVTGAPCHGAQGALHTHTQGAWFVENTLGGKWQKNATAKMS